MLFFYQDNSYKVAELSALVKEMDAFENKKMALEEKIMRKLEEQTTNDKAAKYMTKLLNNIKIKNRDLVFCTSGFNSLITSCLA